MTNEQVMNGFDEVYNGFWKRYRDKPPDRDSPEWDRMYANMVELQQKYPFMEQTVLKMLIEFDERMRKNERP